MTKEQLKNKVNNLEFAQVFEELGKKKLSSLQKATLVTLRQEFVLNQTNIHFTTRLHTLIDEVFEEKDEPKPKSNKTKYILITFIAILTSFATWQLFFTEPTQKCVFDEKNTDFKVLILPFKAYGCDKDDMGEEIQRQLKNLNDIEKLEITAYFAHTLYITENFDKDSAHFLKEKYCADMVIYGNYRKDECSSQTAQDVCFSWYMDSLRTQDQKHEQVALTELSQGKMQGSVKSIIFWVAAQKNLDRQNYKQALRHLLYIQDTLQVNSAGLKHWLGYCYQINNEYQEAKKYYQQSIDLGANAAVYNNFAVLLTDEPFKEYDSARYYYEKAIQINPNYAESYNNLASLLVNEPFKEYDSARYYYEKAIQINPNYTYAYNNLALLLKHEPFKEYDKAKELFEKAIQIDSNYAKAYNNLASFLATHFEDYKNAEKNLLIALKINPNLAEANVMYAQLLFYYKKPMYINDIKSYYRKGVALKPSLRNIEFEQAFKAKTNQNLLE